MLGSSLLTPPSSQPLDSSPSSPPSPSPPASHTAQSLATTKPAPAPAPPHSSEFPQLPPELLLHIATFIPPRERRKLISVHRLFFELIMSEAYSQLSFISSDPKIFVEKLRSLQGPTGLLADRVRVLTLWPSAVREALSAPDPTKKQEKLEAKFQKHTRTPSDILKRSKEYMEELLALGSSGTRSQSPVPWVLPPTNQGLPTPEERARMFQDAIRNLKGVEEFEVSWYVDHGAPQHAWTFPYFPIIWQNVGTHLRRISIDAQLVRLVSVLSSASALSSFPNVEELHLTIRNEITLDEKPNNKVIPFFVNKLAGSLKSLSLKTIGHQDLTFLRLLGHFPHMHKLALMAPLDATHLPDPQGLTQLLQNHPRISELSLRYSRCCRDCTDDGFKVTISGPQGRHLIYSDIALPILRALELGLAIPIPKWTDVPGQSMIRSVSRMGEHLSTLTLKDRSLTLEEATTVLQAFEGSRRLKKLSMYAKHLSPQLVDLIARSCPVLSIWEVDVQMVVRSETVGGGGMVDDVEGFASAIFNYAVDLDNDRWRYRTWTLSDISVMKWEFKVGHSYSWKTMNAIAAVVPTVRSFAGRGDMEEERSWDAKTRRAQMQIEPSRRNGHIGVDYGERGRPWDN